MNILLISIIGLNKIETLLNGKLLVEFKGLFFLNLKKNCEKYKMKFFSTTYFEDEFVYVIINEDPFENRMIFEIVSWYNERKNRFIRRNLKMMGYTLTDNLNGNIKTDKRGYNFLDLSIINVKKIDFSEKILKGDFVDFNGLYRPLRKIENKSELYNLLKKIYFNLQDKCEKIKYEEYKPIVEKNMKCPKCGSGKIIYAGGTAGASGTICTDCGYFLGP